jgi:TPR repeat protein
MWENEPDIDELRRLHDLSRIDPAQALSGLRQLADRGSPMSMIYIANAYQNGTGTEVDLVRANEWYRRASAAGSLLASYELGRNHLASNNYEQARETFSLGAGKEYPPSMNMLAMMQIRGQGGPVDLNGARDLLEAAVARGHVFSKRNLGVLLMKGRFGMWQIIRGFVLFIGAIKDALVLVPRDRSHERLR